MNNNLHTAAVKLSTMTHMASEASRYAMAAAVDGGLWLGPARQHLADLKRYITEIEYLIGLPAEEK